MALQESFNQLLTQTAYFFQPIAAKKKEEAQKKAQEEADEKAFQKAQEEANKRTDEAYKLLSNTKEGLPEEIAAYATNLDVNKQKAAFERTPNKETLKDWQQAIYAKEELMGTYQDEKERFKAENWKAEATKQIKQQLAFDALREQIKKEEEEKINGSKK